MPEDISLTLIIPSEAACVRRLYLFDIVKITPGRTWGCFRSKTLILITSWTIFVKHRVLVMVRDEGKQGLVEFDAWKKAAPQTTYRRWKKRTKLEALGLKCARCGYHEFWESLHIHHIVPRRKGGKDVPENLIVLCANCHFAYEHGKILKSEIVELKRKQGNAPVTALLAERVKEPAPTP